MMKKYDWQGFLHRAGFTPGARIAIGLKEIGLRESQLAFDVSEDGATVSGLDIYIGENERGSGTDVIKGVLHGLQALGVAEVQAVASKIGALAWTRDTRYEFDVSRPDAARAFAQSVSARLGRIEAQCERAALPPAFDGFKRDLQEIRALVDAPELARDLPHLIALAATRIPLKIMAGVKDCSPSAQFKISRDPTLSQALLLDTQWPMRIDLKGFSRPGGG